MSPAARKREAQKQLARMVEAILYDPGKPMRVQDLAKEMGYGRSHFVRHFTANVGESPSDMVRRVRLEKAAYLLLHTSKSIDEISESVGYSNPTAFTRAFRGLRGMAPRTFRFTPGVAWIHGPMTLIHWTPLLDQTYGEEDRVARKRFPLVFRHRDPVRLAVKRRVGGYNRTGEAWEELAKAEPRWALRRCFTIYYDKVWTYPDSNGMRSDLGFELLPGEQPPEGYRELTIPGGRFATLDVGVARRDRDAAWSWMDKVLTVGVDPALKAPTTHWGFDEYDRLPVPWEQAITWVWVSSG